MKPIEEYGHFCDDQKNVYFVVYSLPDKSTRKYEVPYETHYYFDSVQVKNQIYFTGGGLKPSGSKGEQFFHTTMRMTIKADMDTMLEKLADMNVSRANHTLVALTPNMLYVVGGCNSKAEIPSCEEYNVLEKKWRNIAYLNERKMWVSVCAFQSRYLYAFGGSTNLKVKETSLIESLDTSEKDATMWAKVELSSGKDLFKKSFFIGCMQMAPEEILIFGGVSEKVEIDDVLVFVPKSKALIKGPPLAKKDAFYRAKPAICGDELMIVGSLQSDMHIYTLSTKKWQVLHKSSWNPDEVLSLKSDTV